MEKKTKITIIVLAIIMLGLLILDAKNAEQTCGEGNYNQSTGFCREEQ